MPTVPLNAAPWRPAPATKDVGWVQTAVLLGWAGGPASAWVTEAAFGRPVAKAKVFGEKPGAKAGIRPVGLATETFGTLPPMLVLALATVVLPTVPVACALTANTGPVPGVEALAATLPVVRVRVARACAAPPALPVPPNALAVASTSLVEARLMLATAPPPMPLLAPLLMPPLPPFAVAVPVRVEDCAKTGGKV